MRSLLGSLERAATEILDQTHAGEDGRRPHRREHLRRCFPESATPAERCFPQPEAPETGCFPGQGRRQLPAR